VRDRAQGPRHHDHVEERIRERKLLPRRSQQRHLNAQVRDALSRERRQFWGWIDCKDVIDGPAI
jgi:hypothetical protein